MEERNPDKRIIHVIWDNAAYHKGPDVRAFLARTACRIHLIQLPPYCPHLNPIERLSLIGSDASPSSRLQRRH
ncbi:transposase [Roseovarius sp. D0-M9]|uniref:transposase n=1 Tax=Roseovarius sp. D0-M9 TaxID=3127117 RepID=UPI00300FC496